MNTNIAELDIEHPALTRRPPARDGMVIHSVYDTSMYGGSEVQRRYLAAENGEQRRVALGEMPDATVTFHEVPVGQSLFGEP